MASAGEFIDHRGPKNGHCAHPGISRVVSSDLTGLDDVMAIILAAVTSDWGVDAIAGLGPLAVSSDFHSS